MRIKLKLEADGDAAGLPQAQQAAKELEGFLRTPMVLALLKARGITLVGSPTVTVEKKSQ